MKEGYERTSHAADARITVLFGLDSSALSDAEKARLSSFVKSLDAETKGGNLFVTGYTCDLGSKAHNDVLAIERAEAVETYLRKAGLHVMWVTGTGKCCYATKKTRVSDTSTGGLRSQSAKGRPQSEKDTRIVCYVRDYGGSAGVIVRCCAEQEEVRQMLAKSFPGIKVGGDTRFRHSRTL